jgi:hypothetical protein
MVAIGLATTDSIREQRNRHGSSRLPVEGEIVTETTLKIIFACAAG